MRSTTDTLVILSGTSAGAVGMDFERKRQARIRSLERRLGAQPSEATRDRITDLREAVHLLALDVDATGTYITHPPLVPDEGWPTGSFIHCRLPGPDLVSRIERGWQRGRFEHLNPDAIRALHAAENGSGGIRTNGWLATETSIDVIEQQIRSRLDLILRRLRVASRSDAHTLRVILVAGTFGGFGSGSYELLRRTVLRIAAELQVTAEITCILIVPGTNAPKDPDNTLAVTYSVVKELAAQSTGHHWHRGPGGARTRTRFTPPILVSDTNDAPGDPKALSIEGSTGMLSELLWTLIDTPVGARLGAAAGDFEVRSHELTDRGEPRFCRTVGISTIHLDRERLLRYASSRLVYEGVSQALIAVELETVLRDAQAFLEIRRLLEGAGVDQLSSRLLERGDGAEGASELDRFRTLFARGTESLRGLDALRHGAVRLRVAADNSGDVETAIAARAGDLVGQVERDIHDHTRRMAMDPRRGFAAASQWASELSRIIETLAAEASADSTRLDDEIEELERRVEFFENVALPAIERRWRISRWLRAGRIDNQGAEYLRALGALHCLRLRSRARTAAVDVLQRIGEAANRRLAEVQDALDTLLAVREQAAQSREAAAAFRPQFGCPVGLPLLSTQEDLDDILGRILPAPEAADAVGTLHRQIVDLEDPTAVRDAGRIGKRLGLHAEQILTPRVERLHVIDELRRRRESLGPILRERVRESFEYLQLKDGSHHESGEHLIRLIGADAGRLGDLADVLARHDYPRRVPFQTIDTGDPERIVFLQYRAVLPFSDWAHLPRAREAYERSTRTMAFEKYHVVAGERALPEPGDRLDAAQVRSVLLKARLLDRLELDPASGRLRLRSGDDTEAPADLGADLETLRGVDGYRRAVDVVSHFVSDTLRRGPEHYARKLRGIQRVSGTNGDGEGALDALVRSLVPQPVVDAQDAELETLRRGSVPAAMAWGTPQAEEALVEPR